MITREETSITRMNCSVEIQKNCSSNSPTSSAFSISDKVTFIFLGVLAVLIFVANSTVIFLYKNNRYLRTVTNFCLVFLAVSDLLSSIVAIPMIIICNTTEFSCITMDVSTRFIAISTILHLMVVSTERYLMIVFPMYYIKLVTKPRIIVALVSVWLLSLTVALIQFYWIVDESHTGQHDLIYSSTTFFGIVLPVLGFMIFIYSKIFRVLRIQIENIRKLNVPSSSRDTANELKERGQFKRGELRALVVFALMMITFVLGWFPYFILTFLYDLQIPIYTSSEFWLFSRYATSLVNPLLYTFLKMDFKRALTGQMRKKMSYKSVKTQSNTLV